MKQIYYSILFSQELVNGLDFPIFLPERPLIGTLNESTSTMKELFSGEEYLNTDLAYAMDLPNGFNICMDYKTILRFMKNKGIISAKKAFEVLWLAYQNMVCFYDENTCKFICMEKKSFENTYNIKLETINSLQINEMTKDLIRGNITPEEYYEKLYPSQEEYLAEGTKVIEDPSKLRISEAINTIKKYIISQDDAVKKLVTAIYKHILFREYNMKSNILIYGPTGVGKTELIRSVSKVFDIPVLIEDMTRFTDIGYVGASVDDIMISLFQNANGDLERAENSILFLDEIDKKASSDDKDFNKGDVLRGLLKIIEGGRFDIQVNKTQTVTFDTSKLIVIVGGAFTSLYNKLLVEEKTIGFGSKLEKKDIEDKKITIEDFVKYGMPVEFMGRIKIIIRLNSLTKEDFIEILKNSELSQLRNYTKALESKGVGLDIPESIYEKIAEQAITLGIGARSLNVIVDEMFENILYDYFNSIDSVENVKLGNNIVDMKGDYTLVHRKEG